MKCEWQYDTGYGIKVWSMPKQRLPTIAGRAVWDKVTKGRAGIRWDSAVESMGGYRWKPRRDTVHASLEDTRQK